MESSRWRPRSFSPPAFAGLLGDLQHDFQSDPHLPLQELRALAKDPNSGAVAQGLLHLGRTLRFQHPELAAKIFRQLSESTAPESVRSPAIEESKALSGIGSMHTEILLNQATTQASDYRFIGPMIAATVVGEIAGAAALSRLSNSARSGVFSRGLAARTLAGTAALIPESAAFTMASRLFRGCSSSSLTEELKNNALSLGAFKLSGAIGNQARLKLQKANAGALAEAVFPQAALLLGLYGAQRIEGRSPTPTELLASLVGMQVGSHLGNHFLGERFADFRDELGRRTELSMQRPTAGLNFSKRLTPQFALSGDDALTGPLWMSEHDGGKGPFNGIKNWLGSARARAAKPADSKAKESPYRDPKDGSDFGLLKNALAKLTFDDETGITSGHLSRPSQYHGVEWPIGTQVNLFETAEGDLEIDSFVSPRNLEIQGLPVRKGSPIRFHLNGQLKSATLSRKTGARHDLWLGEEIHFTADRGFKLSQNQLKSIALWGSRKPLGAWLAAAPTIFSIAGLVFNSFVSPKYESDLENYFRDKQNYEAARSSWKQAADAAARSAARDLSEYRSRLEQFKEYQKELERLKDLGESLPPPTPAPHTPSIDFGDDDFSFEFKKPKSPWVTHEPTPPILWTPPPFTAIEPVRPVRENIFNSKALPVFMAVYGAVALLLLSRRSQAKRRKGAIEGTNKESELNEIFEVRKSRVSKPQEPAPVKQRVAVNSPAPAVIPPQSQEAIDAQAEREAEEESDVPENGLKRRGE